MDRDLLQEIVASARVATTNDGKERRVVFSASPCISFFRVRLDLIEFCGSKGWSVSTIIVPPGGGRREPLPQPSPTPAAATAALAKICRIIHSSAQEPAPGVQERARCATAPAHASARLGGSTWHA